MKHILLLVALTATMSAQAKEMRCGWLYNPSPANGWLIDAEGEWTLTTQGQPNAFTDEDKAFDLMSKASENKKSFVVTNGLDYGYSCACLTVTTQKSTVTAIHQAKQLPLRKCRTDKAISGKEPKE